MELWTKEHAITLLPALVAMVLIGWLLRKLLGKKEERVRLIPVQVLTCALLLLEVGKQALSFRQGYDLYHIPLHFCSLFLYVLPFFAFYRGKHRQAVTAISAGICGSLFLLMLIYPNLIYGAWNIRDFFKGYFDFHTVAFHNIVMLVFVLIIALDLHVPEQKGGWKPCALFTAAFCVVSASMAQILETNYANFYRCNIPPLEAVRAKVQELAGYVPTQCLYVLIVSLLTVGFVIMCYQIYRGVYRLIARQKQPAVQK